MGERPGIATQLNQTRWFPHAPRQRPSLLACMQVPNKHAPKVGLHEMCTSASALIRAYIRVRAGASDAAACPPQHHAAPVHKRSRFGAFRQQCPRRSAQFKTNTGPRPCCRGFFLYLETMTVYQLLRAEHVFKLEGV